MIGINNLDWHAEHLIWFLHQRQSFLEMDFRAIDVCGTASDTHVQVKVAGIGRT